MAHHHDHSHAHAHTHTANKQVLRISFFVIAGFMLVEAVGGWLTNSLALLSDAGHMFSDAFSLGVALWAFKLGEKQITLQKTFGYKRFEIVLEALKISTYSVENINDMGDKAELKIKVKAVDFVGLSDEVLKNYKAKNNQSEEEVMIESMKELYNTVKSGKAPMKEEEMTVQMVKENDKWIIDDNTRDELMFKMMGTPQGNPVNF